MDLLKEVDAQIETLKWAVYHGTELDGDSALLDLFERIKLSLEEQEANGNSGYHVCTMGYPGCAERGYCDGSC